MAFLKLKSLLGSVTLALAIAACDADSLRTLDPAPNDVSGSTPDVDEAPEPGTPTVTAQGPAGVSLGETVQVTAQVADEDGLDSCRLLDGDGVTLDEVTLDGESNTTIRFEYEATEAGFRGFVVECTDRREQTGASDLVTIEATTRSQAARNDVAPIVGSLAQWDGVVFSTFEPLSAISVPVSDDGTVLFCLELIARGGQVIPRDGKVTLGVVVPLPGDFMLQIACTDDAGNVGVSDVITILVRIPDDPIGATYPGDGTNLAAGVATRFSAQFGGTGRFNSCAMVLERGEGTSQELRADVSERETSVMLSIDDPGDYAVHFECTSPGLLTRNRAITVHLKADSESPSIANLVWTPADEHPYLDGTYTFTADVSDDVGVKECFFRYFASDFFSGELPALYSEGRVSATVPHFEGAETFGFLCRDYTDKQTTASRSLPYSIIAPGYVNTVPPTVAAVAPLQATMNQPVTFMWDYADDEGVVGCDLFVWDFNAGSTLGLNYLIYRVPTFGNKSGTATYTFTPFITGNFLPSGSGELGVYAYCFDAARNYPRNVPFSTVAVSP